MYIPGASSVEIADSTVSLNQAGTDGGGVYISNTEAPSPRITNTTISGNGAGREGGGMFVLNGETEVTNVTIARNTAPAGSGVATFGGGVPPSIKAKNSIVAENLPGSCAGPLVSLS
jgi:hypothetical protein